MAFNKRTWLGRQGTGLNKFSIGGATPVTIVNQPDSVTQVGDALSAGNLNDLEDRIEDAFDDVDTAIESKADETEVTNLNNAISALDHRLENLEQAKGDYIVSAYKDGSTTPSGKGKWCVVEGVEGVSRVENSLATDGNLEDATKWGTTNGSFSVAANIGTLTLNGATGAVYQSQRFALQSGHVYLCAVDIQASNSTMQVRISNAYGGSDVFAQKNTNWQKLVALWTCATTGSHLYPQIYANDASANDTVKIKNFVVTDLSVYFGGTIPSDADTIAEIQTNYPHLLTPSEYGVRIVDSSYSGVRAWARNLWDEVWERGSLDLTTGQPTTYANNFRSKNHILVVGGQTYCLKTPYSSFVLFYDDNDSFLGNSTVASISTPYSTFNAPTNASYALFTVGAGGAYYANNICFNKSDSQNGTYTPYHAPNTLSFSYTGKSAGSVREKKLLNVEVEIDGQKVQKSVKTNPLRRMTFDDDTYWQRSNDGVYFTDSVSGLYDENNLPLCPPYVAVSKASGNSDAYSKGDMTCCFRGTVPDRFYIRDDYAFVTMNYTAAQFKEYIKGKTLTFALATPDPPTYSDPILDNTLLTEAYGRLSTVQTGTVVDGIADLGFITL